MSDLNVVHAAQVALVSDRGEPRRGALQGELDLIADGAVAIRDGRIAAVGPTGEVLREWGDSDVPTIDATGHSVLHGRRTTALSGVDLLIRPGETVALVGETGAGKSDQSAVNSAEKAARPPVGSFWVTLATMYL